MGVAEDEILAKGLGMYRDIAEEYFGRHTIPILYHEQGNDEPELGTGFLLSVDQSTVLVTAGHVCADIAELSRNRRLRFARVCYLRERHGLEWFELPTDSTSVYWDSSKCPADVGLIRLPDALLERMAELGVERVTVNRFRAPTQELTPQHATMIVGASAVHSRQYVKNRLFVVQNGILEERQQHEVGTVGFRMLPIKQVSEDSDVTCAGVPYRDDELSAEGMSGGPVVEIDANEGVDRFAVVGLQSKQWAAQGAITRIAFVPARTVLTVVRQLLQQSGEF